MIRNTKNIKIQKYINLYYQSIPNESIQPANKTNNNLKTNYTISISKVHQFENMPKPRNATKGIICYYIYLIINLLRHNIY